MTILIVEDDLFLREVFTESLRDDGISVFTAEDGTKALDFLQKATFDLVLMDVFLPDMTGIDVASNVKKSHNANADRIFFLTNSDDPKIILQIQSLGYSYAIKSDMTPDQLGEKVKTLIEQLKP